MPYLERNQKSWRWVYVRMRLPDQGGDMFLRREMTDASRVRHQGRSEYQIALAGPVLSFLLAGLFSLAAEASLKLGLSDLFTRVLSYLGSVKLVLAFFNLLPAFPLDGGRVLRAWLWQRPGDIVKPTEIAAKFGQILAYILIGIGFLILFRGV